MLCSYQLLLLVFFLTMQFCVCQFIKDSLTSHHTVVLIPEKKVNEEEKKIEKHVTFITNVFSLSSVLLLLSINFAKARHFPQPCHLRKIKEEMKNSS